MLVYNKILNTKIKLIRGCKNPHNTIKMKNFKITNLKSKVVQYMNESEKEQFFTKNSYGNYNLESWKERRNKKIENIAFSVFTLGSFTILLLLMCGTLGFIDSLIF